ncbi:IS30-like element IS658 family transposase [Halalkalibacterium halodurans]|uniref:Transposase (10) n=2 Tax=Halalkalibacterium halodurans TaxID=86665 RepID=Q9JWR3_HALH5|nr:IS30-like element IS658 family transposase [Halalkalibacterium halodurans]MED4124954.1 IS30-like element IS658 family transposase [Halalkalibacterium halodurans]MED4171989.1 IS30-like element IS658 family transposase [Halalkalibacterium halodurans]BAB06243.1 transposase (10) [Halalkalibacterium halodurans C-125]BAB07222.1 transposase (10) [Halalkalibacterium halodurans C-125]BAB07669.1 transposase (10) [Halalkalibacterium halodurans C-125]
MSYSHLTTFERGRLETLQKLGWSTRQIAKELNRHHSTIARELKRNRTKEYVSEVAHERYVERRKGCKPKGKWSPELATIIEEKLQLTWSPEQIIGRLSELNLSFKTIYRWLYLGLVNKSDLSVLRHKGKRQKPMETRGRFNIGTSIDQRPKEVKKRTTFGHWELDTMVSSRGKSKGCLATFAERKTRMYLAVKMDNRTSSSMETAILRMVNKYPLGVFKTSTVDRGKEFACYSNIEEQVDMAVYFADPYASWQRGTNENANGLLREFFPKKTDLALITEEELELALHLINHRPRKCLGWKTSYEAFWEEVSQLD